MTNMEAPEMTQYLSTLEKELATLPQSERHEIVNEIRAHILDRMQAGAAPSDVLRQMGSPAALGREYTANLSVASAAKSRSPFKLFGAALHLASQGAKGFGVLVVTLIGYGAAFGMFLSVLLKPIFPDRVGLFVGKNGQVFIGMRPYGTEGLTEVLGDHFTVYVSIVAFFVGWGTTELLRAVMRKWRG
jgi:uncharacterized membrane protein